MKSRMLVSAACVVGVLLLAGAKAHLDAGGDALLIFEDQTGIQVDFDFRGTLDEVLASRLAFYKEHQNFMNDQFLDSWTIDGARLDLSLYRMTNESAVVPGQTSSGGRYSFHFTFKRIE